MFEKHEKYEGRGEIIVQNPLEIPENRIQNAKTGFQNAETAQSRISFASTWMEVAQKNCLTVQYCKF